MNKEIREGIYLLLSLLVLLIGLKIAFYEESIITIIKTGVSLFWIFILPGFTVMYYWKERLPFLERLVIGVALSASTTGILSYYLGLIGVNVRYHSIILPTLLILIGIVLFLKRKKVN